MTVTLRSEEMNDFFTKIYLHGFEELGITGSFNRFSKADEGEEYHSHNFDFRTFILHGGYQEEIVDFDSKGKPFTHLMNRLPGSSHVVAATCIHKITKLFEPKCLTLMIRLAPDSQKPTFYRFGDAGVEYRFWDETEWKTYALPH